MIFEVKRFPYKARRIGRLIFTTCRQGSYAPFIDCAWTYDREGNKYTSKAIVWPFGNRNQYGERNPRRAFVVGWRE